MSVEITMPQLSDTMEEGTVVKWLKKEGDKVKAGEEIVEIETDKATMPVEAFESGTLEKIVVKEGEKIQVGKPIAYLSGGKGGDSKPAPKQAEPAQAKSAAAGSGASKIPNYSDAGTAVAFARGETYGEHAIGEHATQGTHATIAPKEAEAHAPDHNGIRIKASPVARRIAATKGIDLSQVKGSGPDGRIVQKDVENFVPKAAPGTGAKEGAIEKTKPTAPPAQVLTTRIARGQKQVVPLTKIRSVIAQRLQQSKQTIPHFYETIDIDVEDLGKLRERVNKNLEKTGVRISIADFVAKAVAMALLQHRELNATFDGKEITQHGDVNLGMAVALPSGLIVPVLRNIDQMGLAEIRVRSADLVERARAQRLKQDELTGATFTVSNLGTFGVREFSAIINPPEVGILAIAAAEKRAVVKGEQIVARSMMTVTLSCDHRAVDGATAADYLRTLKNLLEEPGLMLV
jgi:pyruvate dehydrogenase E2 component (dihydrolipoamide acetyltransferase)